MAGVSYQVINNESGKLSRKREKAQKKESEEPAERRKREIGN
jgi:hypothetical protein